MYYIARTSCIHISIPCFKLLEPFLCHDVFSLHVYSLSIIEYRIAGNFGGGFNLAIWRIFPRIAKFKSVNIKN